MLSKSDRTKLFIIEQSAPIFNTKGYAATTMTDILKATGLAKGGIYGNFKNKDEIALEAFEYSFNKVREALRLKLKQETTSIRKLHAILDFYHNYSITPTVKGGCPLLNTAIDADNTIAFLKARASKYLKEMLNGLKQIIEQGIKDGEFNKNLNPANEAELIFATIEGGMMISRLNNNPETLNRLLENLRMKIQQQYIR